MPPANIDIESPPTEGARDGTRTSGSDEGPGDKAGRASTAALLRNPLVSYSHSELMADVDAFTEKYGLDEHRDSFRKGALVAQASNRPNGFETIAELTEEEKAVLRKEVTHRWDQPFMLYFLGLLCAGSAIVQICHTFRDQIYDQLTDAARYGPNCRQWCSGRPVPQCHVQRRWLIN